MFTLMNESADSFSLTAAVIFNRNSLLLTNLINILIQLLNIYFCIEFGCLRTQFSLLVGRLRSLSTLARLCLFIHVRQVGSRLLSSATELLPQFLLSGVPRYINHVASEIFLHLALGSNH